MQQSTTDIRIVPLPQGQDVLTEILRDGARRMLAEAVEAEVAAWIDARADFRVSRHWNVAIGVENLGNDKYYLFHPFPQRTLTAELAYRW